MELHELVGVDPPVLIASAAGSVSRVIAVRDVAPGRAAFGIFVGFCVGVFFTPIVDSNKFWDLGAGALIPIAYVLGLSGTIIVAKFIQWVQALDLGPWFDRLLHRSGPTEEKK